MTAFVLNMIMATVWLFLSDEPSLVQFFIGFAIGFGLLFLFENVFGDKIVRIRVFYPSRYVRKMYFFTVFCLWFFYEFLLANLRVAFFILTRPRNRITSQIIRLNVKDLSDFERVVLANSITLTPGTTTVKIDQREECLLYHALNAKSADESRASIELGLMKKILDFTRVSA